MKSIKINLNQFKGSKLSIENLLTAKGGNGATSTHKSKSLCSGSDIDCRNKDSECKEKN